MIARFAGGQARALEHTEGPCVGVVHQALQGLAVLEPADADVAEVVNAMADRVRAEMFRRIGVGDLLRVGGQ